MAKGGTGRQTRATPLIVAMLIALAASACQSTATVADSADPAADAPPPTVDADRDAEADTEIDDRSEDADIPAPTATSEPPAERIAAEVDLQWVLGFSPDSAYAYESSGDAWGEPPACGVDHARGLVAIDLAASTAEQIVGFDAGVSLRGRPDSLVFDADGNGIVLDTCGVWPDDEVRLTPIRVGPDGMLEPTGLTFDLDREPDQQWTWLQGVARPGVAEVEVVFGANGDDDWVRELRHIDLETGITDVLTQVPFEDEVRFTASPVASPDGRFVYTEIDDPAGGIGCEGYGVAASIAVDRGDGPEPMWGADQPVFSSVSDLHFGPDRLVAWSAGCEGYTTPYVGRVLPDGRIVDQHPLDVWNLDAGGEGFTELSRFRLTADGDLIGLGQRFDADYANPEPVLHRFDLSADPYFINSAPTLPWIDTENPLAPTLAGTGEWYVGDGIGAEPGCQSTTLYASTSAGWVRAIEPSRELDRIVDFASSEPRLVEFDDGWSYTSRTIAVLTECADAYPGRQLWFSAEPELPGNGLYFERATIERVADILAVREVPRAEGFGFDVVAEVVFDDGALGDVLLEPVPFVDDQFGSD